MSVTVCTRGYTLNNQTSINACTDSPYSPDAKVPLETQIETLKALAEEGKIESVASSEVNANTIGEAAKLTKISAVEVELSVWTTGPLKNGIVQACAELDIPILA